MTLYMIWFKCYQQNFKKIGSSRFEILKLRNNEKNHYYIRVRATMNSEKCTIRIKVSKQMSENSILQTV